MAITATYSDAVTFTVAGDLTDEFHAGRRVRANCGVDGYKYATILSSSYSSPNTTVILTAGSDDLTSNLAEVLFGIVGIGDYGSLPEHGHGFNSIINGCMRFAQRGTSFVAGANDDDVYTLDRWNLISDGNDIVDVTRQSAGGVNGNSAYLRCDVETVSKKFGIVQVIEASNLVDVIGGLVSISFDCRVSNAAKLSDIRAAVLAWDSTADAVTSDVVSAWAAEGTNPTWAANWTAENTPANLGVTDSWARYVIEGINIDTASAANVALVIWQNNVATNDTLAVTLDITNVQLEPNPVASKFQIRLFGEELALCQRYYEKSYNYPNNAGTATSRGRVHQQPGVGMTATAFKHVSFAVEKRVFPTITMYDLAGTSGMVTRSTDGITANIQQPSTRSFTGGTTDTTSSVSMFYHWTADAEL